MIFVIIVIVITVFLFKPQITSFANYVDVNDLLLKKPNNILTTLSDSIF